MGRRACLNFSNKFPCCASSFLSARDCSITACSLLVKIVLLHLTTEDLLSIQASKVLPSTNRRLPMTIDAFISSLVRFFFSSSLVLLLVRFSFCLPADDCNIQPPRSKPARCVRICQCLLPYRVLDSTVQDRFLLCLPHKRPPAVLHLHLLAAAGNGLWQLIGPWRLLHFWLIIPGTICAAWFLL